MDETETQTGASAVATPEPSPAGNIMTEAGLAAVLKQSRVAQRASSATQGTPTGSSDATTDNGSTPNDDDTQGQPAASAQGSRPDDSTLDNQGDDTEASDDAGEGEGEGDDTEGKSRRELKDQKRWDRLTAKLKAKDQELAELRQRLNGGSDTQAQSQQAQRPAAFQHPELAPLDQQIRQARAVLEWCETNPDGGEVRNADGKSADLSAADVRRYKVNAQAALSELAAQRAAKEQTLRQEFTTRQAEARKVVETEYPALNDPHSEEFAAAVEYLQSLPKHVVEVMQSMPDSRLVLADLIAGRNARLAKASKATAPAARTVARPIPQPGRVAAAAPRVAPERKALQEARSKFESSGRTSDLRTVLANRRRAARTAV